MVFKLFCLKNTNFLCLRTLLLVFISNFFGSLRVLSFSTSLILLMLISFKLIKIDEDNSEQDKNEENIDSKNIPLNYETSGTHERLDQALSSDSHLRIIISLFALIFVARYDTLLVLIAFLFLIECVIRTGCKLINSNFI